MMRFLNRWSLLATVAVAALSVPSYGVTAYSIPAPVSGNQNFGGPLGMDFNTTLPITISHLGVFDSNADGLAVPLTAHLYDRTNTAAPIATLNFAAGNTGTLVGSQRFLQLGSPLNLPAGFQGTIVAEGYGATELNGNGGGGTFGGTVLNSAGALNYVGTSRFGFTPGQFPTNGDTSVAQYGAGTFQFDVAKHVNGPVTFQNPTAILSQGGFPVSALIDGNVTPSVGAGWANSALGDNTAVLETTRNITGDNILSFEIVSGGFGTHTLGRFRLSVTSDDRTTFADGLANGGDVIANWTVLDIQTAKSSNAGTILTELGDGSILASGGPAEVETYFLTSFFQGTITGVRLEAIEDPSLPFNGPGRSSSNGNFVVLELSMNAVQVPEPASAALLLMGAAGLMRRRQRA